MRNDSGSIEVGSSGQRRRRKGRDTVARATGPWQGAPHTLDQMALELSEEGAAKCSLHRKLQDQIHLLSMAAPLSVGPCSPHQGPPQVALLTGLLAPAWLAPRAPPPSMRARIHPRALAIPERSTPAMAHCRRRRPGCRAK